MIFPRVVILAPDPLLFSPENKKYFFYLEDDLIVGDVVQNILGHTIMNQGRNGIELLLGQRLSMLCPDQVSLTSFNSLDMSVEVAHLSDIRGLGGPRGDGTDARQDDEKVESFL